MKITKKTTLKPALKRVQIDTFEIHSTSDFELTGLNFEGVIGFREDDMVRTFPVTFTNSSGESATTLAGQRPGPEPSDHWSGNLVEIPIVEGEVYTVSIATDPAKTEWKTETVSKSAVAQN